jgi:hypothetical protein
MFLAIGTFLILLGAQCLGVEKFILKPREGAAQAAAQPALFAPQGPAPAAKRELVPPPWAAWSLMSTGAVVCLYSFNIPARLNG